MAYVIDCIDGEAILLELKCDSSIVLEQNDSTNAVNVLVGCLSEYHDFVQVNKCKLPFDAGLDHVPYCVEMCKKHFVKQRARE